MNIKENMKKNHSELTASYKKEELDLKIKNRYSWLIIVSILIAIISMAYVLIFGSIKISIDSLVSVLLAFFSIYLSSLFYFKATEQSNQFYDRTYKYTKDINVLLSKMEGKFNKSLDIIEKGNESIREKMEGNFDFLNYVGETNHSIQSINHKKDTILENRLFSKLKISEEEKTSIKQELNSLEKEKALLQYQLSELLEENDLKTNSSNSHNDKQHRENIVKWYQNKKGKNSFPGTIQEMIYDYGAKNILNMSDEKLRNILREIILEPNENIDKNIDKNIKNTIFKTLVNIGYIDEKTKDISAELIQHVRNEAKTFIE